MTLVDDYDNCTSQDLETLFDQLCSLTRTNPVLVYKNIESLSGLFSQPEDILQPDKLDDYFRRANLETSATKHRYLTTFREQIAEIKSFHHSILDQVATVKSANNHINSALLICSETVKTVPPNFNTIRLISIAHRNSTNVKTILSQIDSSDTDMKRVLYLLQKEKYFFDNLTKLYETDPKFNDQDTSLSKFNIPIGIHLYLIYIKLHLLLDWKNNASTECKNMENYQLPKNDPGTVFTKNLIENRLELFFHPLSNIVSVHKRLWTELLDFVVKCLSLQGAKLYDPYSSSDSMDIIIRKNINPNSIPWYDLYANILNVYSRIIATREKYSSSVQLNFITYENFIGTWNSFIIDSISKCFNDHITSLPSETLIDLLSRIDGPLCLGYVAWIYLYALPLFSSIFKSEYSNCFIFCSNFILNLKICLLQYLENDIALTNTNIQSHFSTIPPSDCLYLLSWMTVFYKRLGAILAHSELKNIHLPDLLTNTQIDFIIGRYVDHTTNMVKEWLGNLFSAEHQKIILRVEPPSSNRFGKYYTSISSEVIHLGLTCKNPNLFPKLIGSILKISLGSFQKNFIDLYTKEMMKVYGSECINSPLLVQDNNSSSSPPGLEFYGIALINSAYQWNDELLHLKGSLPREIISPIILDSFQSATIEFNSMTNLGLHLLNCSIFSDLSPIVKNLYTSTWYQGPNTTRPMEIICDTIDDFLSDYESRLEPVPFQNLCFGFFSNLTRAILKKMTHKSSRFQIERVNELLTYDHNQLNGMWTKFVKKSESFPLSVLLLVYPLLISTDKTILVAFYNLYREYPDVPISFFEQIISRRNDLDKSIVKTLVNSAKEHIKNLNIKRGNIHNNDGEQYKVGLF